MAEVRTLRAPRGNQLTCKGWVQEAAWRMLQNNLDPENAESPDELVVYGGRGKAARNWESLDALLDCLTRLRDDQTLLVQSGKPVAVMPSHPDAPRVLIANSNLVGRWANWERIMDLHRHAGDSAGHLRDLRRARAQTRVWYPEGQAHRDRRARWNGWCATARRDHE